MPPLEPEATALARRLLVELEAHARFLTSDMQRMQRQVIAGGLMACRAHLEAVCTLAEAGCGESLGLLQRAVFEIVMVGRYVLRKRDGGSDDSPFRELLRDYWARSDKLVRATGLGGQRIQALMADWRETVEQAGAAPLPDLRSMAEQLDSLGASQGALVRVYDFVYRGESAQSAHPGIGLFSRFIEIDQRGEKYALRLRPGSAFAGPVLSTLSWTAILTERVLEEFRVKASDALNDIFESINRMTKAANENGPPT